MAQEAVYELTKSPDLAILTAAKESVEKNPGKKTIHQTTATIELRIKAFLIIVSLSVLGE